MDPLNVTKYFLCDTGIQVWEMKVSFSGEKVENGGCQRGRRGNERSNPVLNIEER
jgi:hypothetical protein